MTTLEVAVARAAERIRTRLSDAAIDDADVGWLPQAAGPEVARDGPLAALDPVEADVLVIAGLIELDIRYGALFATLQDPLAARRPCVGLVNWLLGDGETDVLAVCHDLVRRGLLAVDNDTDPRLEWTLRVPVPVWDVVRSGRIDAETLPAGLTLRTGFPPLAEVAVAAEQQELRARLPGMLSDRGLSALVVRGARGAGRTTLLGAAAATLGLDVLVHDGDPSAPGWHVFEALAALCPVLPVVRIDIAPGETVQLPPLRGVERPLGVVAGRSGGVAGPTLEHALTITLAPCGPGDRHRLWAASEASMRTTDLDEIVEQFLLTPGDIRRAAPVAQLHARADGRDSVGPDDVRAATRTLRRQELETLAALLEPLPVRAGPVLSAAARDEFENLLLRCRHRERLIEAAARPGLNRGVRALFTGGSGTGKTLAARHLAARLDLDLYRVDLAAVVNKYIGETERNLDRVLARAEELDVVLLLDEGDALMTRRTDVANANDRYANLETNFLLQRLETFDGIVIVTSNAAGRIDQAFLRRIDVTIDFAAPDAEQRWLIWLAHLPTEHEVDDNVLRDIARRCALSGGQIRNAALHATLLSLDRGDAVSSADLLRSVRREYRRAGAAYPLEGKIAMQTGS